MINNANDRGRQALKEHIAAVRRHKEATRSSPSTQKS